MYTRKTTIAVIDKNGKWSAGGCNTYMFYNMSNVNATINGLLVLRPGQFISGPTENFEIQDFTDFEIQFDMANDPEVVQPDTGAAPIPREYFPGDPPPPRDTRMIIFSSFLTKQHDTK